MPEEDGYSFNRIVVWDFRTGRVIGELDRDGVEGVELQVPDAPWHPVPPMLDFTMSVDLTPEGVALFNELIGRMDGRTGARLARAKSQHRARRGRTKR